MNFALRQSSFLGLILLVGIFGAGLQALAKIDSLPPALSGVETEIEKAHNAGVAAFFKELNQDCDSLDVLHMNFRAIKRPQGTPQLFRIESRVLASCERQDIWFCDSSFTLAPQSIVYNQTNCEVDGPEFED